MIEIDDPSGLLTKKVIHIARPDGSQAVAPIFEGAEDAILAVHALCHKFGTSMCGPCDGLFGRKPKWRCVVFSPDEAHEVSTLEPDRHVLTTGMGRVAVSIVK